MCAHRLHNLAAGKDAQCHCQSVSVPTEIDECDRETHGLILAIITKRSQRKSGDENGRHKQHGCASPDCVAHLPPGRAPARQPGMSAVTTASSA